MPVPPHLLAAIRQPAFEYGAARTVVAANDLAAAWAGEPLADMSMSDVVASFRARHRDGRPLLPHELPAARALAGEEVVDLPLTVTAADGRTVHILATASPLLEEGATPGALAIWQDVTALVEAEERERREREEVQMQNEELQLQQEELRVQEEELRCQAEELRDQGAVLRTTLERLGFAQRAAQTGFWDWDMRTDRLAWSPEFYELLGLHPSAPATFGTWLAAMHPDDHEPAMATIDRAVRERTRLENQYRIVLPGGTVRWVGAYGDTTYDAEGTPVRMAGICVDITERKRAESEVRTLMASVQQEKEKLSALVNSLPDEVWFADPDKQIALVNPAVLAEFGADTLDQADVEAIARNSEVYRPDGTPRPVEEAPPLRALTGEIVRNQEEIVRTPASGELRYRQVNAVPVRDDAGAIIGSVAVVRDITERKRAEEAVRTSEEKFSRAFANNPAAIALTRLEDGLFLDVNETWVGLTGYRRDEAIGRSARQMPIWPTAEAADRFVCELRENGLVQGWEQEFQTKSGGRFVAQLAAQVLTVNNEPVILSTLVDITGRKRAEEALQESEERFRVAQDLSPDGFIVFHPERDADGQVVDFTWVYENAAVARMNGTDPDRVVGRRLLETFPSNAGTRFFEAYREVARTGRPVVVEDSYEGESIGQRTWFRTAVTRTGEDIAVLVQDITESKRAEEALRQYAENLQRSNEDLERFAYVSSHDLQEPLRAIVSFSQLLERRYKGQLDSDADEYIEFIVEGGNRMQTLIQDLLAYSRVNSKAQERRPTDVEDVMAAVERHLDLQLREAGAVLTADPLPTVTADPLQLEQVLANLVSNAVKFRRPGEPLRIHVGARRLDGFWEFSVADNGIGIDPQYHDQIFVIFQRLHTKDAYPGTGIGLAIVKRIVDRHGGTIRVESVPGEGTTFLFTLPAA